MIKRQIRNVNKAGTRRGACPTRSYGGGSKRDKRSQSPIARAAGVPRSGTTDCGKPSATVKATREALGLTLANIKAPKRQ